MTLAKTIMKKRIAVANKDIPADIVVKNGYIIDVFNGELLSGDLAIAEGLIVGIGEYEGEHVIDAKGRYVSPSFIDGHVHVESSMLVPSEFAKVVLPHGVTTVITDPHEIANVKGTEGISYMLENAERSPLDFLFMLPSCVPATPFENAGAALTAEDLTSFYSHQNVHGLAEVMDYPSLQSGEDGMLDKMVQNQSKRSHIDGHLAGLSSQAINVYRASGVQTDHECTTAEEAKERLRRGMYLLLRQGSVAKDEAALMEAVTPHNARRCLFCTDDKHLDDLVEEGSIDYNVRLAIQLGIDPIQAIQMGSLNAAECYGLHDKGAIAPGYAADFLLLDNLEEITIAEVYKGGELVAANNQYVEQSLSAAATPYTLTNSVHIPSLTEKDMRIPIEPDAPAHIIEIIPNNLVTNKRIESVDVQGGFFHPSREKDHQKIIVVERHHKTGNIGLGIVKGFGFETGAIATTIAHDSHNLVATGTNDEDIHTAILAIEAIQGGLVVVQKGKVVVSLPLPIGGLMAEQQYEEVYSGLKEIHKALNHIGFKGDFNPFLTLSFLTLPVIPSLKLTDIGLFDVETFSHVSVTSPIKKQTSI
ncbi:adenine deaminase [Pontibacillus salicampi]|uniref:Adenine deaminase n=1 Tax=Pontibacillus salicampi TaxID=1449801 RepID=A0ABV6LPH5_9BACI